ncbi:MAG: hypothetical protein RPS47_12780 [Colwellia sp.]
MLDPWYDRYESQCWYKNTYLVQEPNQISQVIKGDKEWNNIYGSGCNFVCLSMILGVNPAYLSSALMEKNGYFEEDKRLKSKNLKNNSTLLVWDQNKPNKHLKEVTLKKIHHPVKGVSDVTIKFEKVEFENDIVKAKILIAKHKSDGKHIICGHEDHSRLVAGTNKGEYFLWDPDLDSTDLEKNLAGDHSLEWFYELYSKEDEYINKKAQYWIYSIIFDDV